MYKVGVHVTSAVNESIKFNIRTTGMLLAIPCSAAHTHNNVLIPPPATVSIGYMWRFLYPCYFLQVRIAQFLLQIYDIYSKFTITFVL
jgi:hypothetical protein